MSDDWAYTTEPVRGALFVGAITDEMVDRGARALYVHEGYNTRIDWDEAGERQWKRTWREQARAVLAGALREQQDTTEANDG